MIIRTPEDWWRVVDTYWNEILDIFSNSGAPLGRDESGYWYCAGIGEPCERHPERLITVLENAKMYRDHETLIQWFNLAWLAAPDRLDIHSWPRWGDFCDLCSEGWVFYEDEDEIESED